MESIYHPFWVALADYTAAVADAKGYVWHGGMWLPIIGERPQDAKRVSVTWMRTNKPLDKQGNRE